MELLPCGGQFQTTSKLDLMTGEIDRLIKLLL